MYRKIIPILLVLCFFPAYITTASAFQLHKSDESVDNLATQIPVLMYHGLLKEEENKNYRNNSAIIPVSEFEKQMKYLAENGYHTVSVAEMEAFLNGEIQLPKKSVMIQFDDGLRSVYRYAFPIMKKYGLTGTANIISVRTEKDYGKKWDPDRNQYMDEAMLDKIKSVFEFQGHTYDMHSKSNGKSYLVIKPLHAMKKDFLLSKKKLAKYGEVTLFAYPFGQYNDRTIQALKETGYTQAYTIKEHYVKSWDDKYELGRFGIDPKVDMKTFKKIVSNTSAPIFSDIPRKHPNYEQMFWLYSNHIIKGYPDGSFKPNENINRGQAAKMLVQALGLKVPDKVSKAPFTDLPLNYGDNYLMRAASVLKKAGIFNGDNGAFRPNDVLTRQQMATVLVNTFKWKNSGEAVVVNDMDKADPSHQPNIKILAQKGITVIPNGEFRPNDPTRRMHLASFLYKISELD